MSAALLHRLNEAGVMLWWDGQALRYRAPRGVLTPELREDMREERGALIVAAQARGGVLLPEDQRSWPASLREEHRALVHELSATTRISRREAERRAAVKAAMAWLRGQVPPESEG